MKEHETENLQDKLQKISDAENRLEIIRKVVGKPPVDLEGLDKLPKQTLSKLSEWDLSKFSGEARLDMALKVGDIRKKITEKALPRLLASREKLTQEIANAQIEDDLSRSLVVAAVGEGEVALPSEAVSLALGIFDHVPDRELTRWAKKERLKPEDCARQATDLVKLALDLREGKVQPVDVLNIVSASYLSKPDVAFQKIRELLAPIVFAQTPREIEKAHYHFARNIRELVDWLGVGGRHILCSAVEKLSALDQSLFLSAASINLCEDLGMVDLETCDSRTFATHIRNTSFDPKGERYETFEKLVGVAIERDESGDLDLVMVVEHLLQPPYHNSVIKELREGARLYDFRDQLMVMFSRHPATYGLSKEIEKELRSLYFDILERELNREGE